MELHEALEQSKSKAARAITAPTKGKLHGWIITCQGNVVLNTATIYRAMWTGEGPRQSDLGYAVYIQEGKAQPLHHERIGELWEVEESLRVNFGITGLDWQPHEIEEA